ncbi:DEAD/DEAH box helicase [Ideonella benzenivorans]|uniref:DEAD/DEAH box helicase n=1 Tax=Ideonella benzenivorans TaxID=2831643 RepID=UPI001CECC4A6|nr:DEAD/DEAH box helicase [Ideonella benzenivorans]
MVPLNADAHTALPPLARVVLAALALGAVPRPRTWVFEALAEPGLREPDTRRPTQEQVREALQTLAQGGWAAQDLRRTGYWSPTSAALPLAWRALLDQARAETLRDTLARCDGYPLLALSRYGPSQLPSVDAAVARLRLEALTGAGLTELSTLETRLPWGCERLDQILPLAVGPVLVDGLAELLAPEVCAIALQEVVAGCLNLLPPPEGLDLDALVARLLTASGPGEAADLGVLRWTYAEWLCAQGQADALDPWLAPALQPTHRPDDAALPGRQAMRTALAAVAQAQAGHWDACINLAEQALVELRKLTGRRTRLLPAQAGTAYALALLARGTPTDWETALKFCLGEGGKREPVLDTPFGFVALAIQMRRGDTRREPGPFRPYTLGGRVQVSPLDLWRWLMRAWLKEGVQPEALSLAELEAAGQLRQRLLAARLTVAVGQLEGALCVLQGESPPAGFFIAGPREHWQQALEALRGIVAPAPAEAAPSAETRLRWVLELDARGGVLDLLAMEQRHGARGWGKLKEVPLSRLQRGAESLSPADAAVARTLQQESYGRTVRFDLPAAVAALVGHPSLALADDPEQLVDLQEAGAELEVLREGERLRVRLWPPMQVGSDEAQPRWGGSAAEQKQLEALRLICVVRDGPHRARLVRLTPAQKRVAQLLGPEGLDIPPQGADQLQQVLTGLGSHFRIHSDDAQTAQAAREVPADARLRAELVPVGEGLQLRLVAAPFGPAWAAEGPRLVPGAGRARLVATLGGESLGVQRDLAAERAHLDTVLQACPPLSAAADEAPCEWSLDDPEQALAVVERLGTLHALQALDWPQGKALKVEGSGLSALTLRVHTRQEWLALEGELAVDEELVLGLQQLLALQKGRKSRFVPLGEGRFLALTQELRERLEALATVAEARAGKEGLASLRIPKVAAPWLQQLTQDLAVTVDEAFAAQLARLDEARAWVPALPRTLQATLRPYQEEGFEWAMRLSYAGLGACLADDMGLGKTLQALAVLLARAGQGAALVVAPTSLVGNWRAEARRFAPSLDVQVYGEPGADRAAQRALDRPGQVLLVSYALLQPEAEAFAARPWATLVLDEAQAIKNAAAKRTQAVFGLQAGFRLALSGTPIENRLGELWSVMQACNPGLLGTQARFNERFAGPIERQRDKTARRQLSRLIAPFILRRTKAQVLDDLPPRTELVLKVQPDAAEQAHYEALRRDALVAAERSLSGDAPGQAQFNILAGLTRLRRAACDPRLVTPSLSLVGAKVQAFGELAAELVANGHKALVFSQFVDFLTLLKGPLDAAGIAYQYLDGSTPAAERMQRVDAFQAGQGDLFLISLKAGGFGLNLTVADYVVIADPWWNPAVEDQATGRAHRIGQQRPVTVYRLVCEGTLEEKILTLHRDKRELAEMLLAGEEGSAMPSCDELVALMREEALPE